MPDGDTNQPKKSRLASIVGWVLSLLPMPLFVFSAIMKLGGSPEMVKGFEHLGWPPRLGTALGILELTCVVVYLIPQTAVLGAILLTGYMGGAIATHVRIGEPIFVQAGLGVVLWLGLYLRDRRLRALIPLRKL